MKQKTKFFTLLLRHVSALLLTALFLSGAAAAKADEGYDSDKIYTALCDMLAEDTDLTLSGTAAQNKTASEALLAPNLFSFGLSRFKEALAAGFSVFPPLIAVILLSTVVGLFAEHLGSGARLLEYASQLCAVFIVLSAAKPVLLAVSAYLQSYTAFMTAVSGTMSVLLAAGGGGGAAAASSASAAFAVSVTQLLSQGVVLPCVRIILALAVLSALSHTVDLSGVIGFLRGFCTWGLGVLFAVFGGVHAATVKVAAGTDTLAVRGIRFTAARLIPVAGNMLSESMRTVIGGVGVLKSTLGGLGIAYILYSLLPALCAVLVLKLAVLAASFCSKLMGTRSHTAFLDSVGGALNVLIAICLFASVSGILIFAVFIETAVAL